MSEQQGENKRGGPLQHELKPAFVCPGLKPCQICLPAKPSQKHQEEGSTDNTCLKKDLGEVIMGAVGIACKGVIRFFDRCVDRDEGAKSCPGGQGFEDRSESCTIEGDT